MSLTSTLRRLGGLFRLQRTGPIGAGGQMALADHLRELRARLLRAILAVVATTIIALFFYDQLLDLIIAPYERAREMLPETTQTKVYVSGIAGALMLQLKLCAVAGLIAASPVWLYQIWAFIAPGLHNHEKRWSFIFISAAGPLFLAGVATSYYILPKAIQVLLSFTPEGVENLNDFDAFFSFITRMLLVFGVAFEIPLFVVLLNLAGVVTGAQLGRYRAWIIVGTFVFAAVATPSTDPFGMTFLAVPMVVLFFVSEVIARLVDRSRRRSREAVPVLSDDEASPL